jgi:hypothetical protein
MTMPARMMSTMKSNTTAAIVAPNSGLELGVMIASRVMIAANAVCVAVERTASPKAAFWAVPSLREKAIASCRVNASITNEAAVNPEKQHVRPRSRWALSSNSWNRQFPNCSEFPKGRGPQRIQRVPSIYRPGRGSSCCVSGRQIRRETLVVSQHTRAADATREQYARGCRRRCKVTARRMQRTVISTASGALGVSGCSTEAGSR